MISEIEDHKDQGDDCGPKVAGIGHCTPLFPLPVIGVGTAAIESLPSYLNRLAAAHGLTTKYLCSKAVFPELGSSYSYLVGGSLENRHVQRLLYPSNVSGKLAGKLAQLTGQSDLRLTTMSNLSKAIELRRHLRLHWWWCPQCMDERYRSRETLYFPLHWSVATYSHCIIHSVPMIHSCQKCGLEWPIMKMKNWTIECRRCGHLQIGGGSFLRKPGDVDRNSWQWKASVQTHDCYKWAADGREISTAMFTTNIRSAIEVTGGARAFAKTFRSHHATINGWRDGAHRPWLASIVNLAIAYNLKIEDLFEGEIDWEKRQALAIDPPKIAPTRKRPLGRFKAALKHAVSGTATVPTSLCSLCRKYHVTFERAHRCFPKLATALITKHKNHVAKLKSQTRQIREARLEKLIGDLMANGREVNTGQIAKLIKERGERDNYTMVALFRKRLKEQGH